jgi:DNA-binding transcriptional LysR family regulator
MDRLNSMAVFVSAVEKGSLAAAAEEFAISATMAGKHLQTLERHLGVRLLNRTTRRQSLTEPGKLYFERCKQLLTDLQDAEDCASELQASPKGTLRITAPVSFGTRRLTPALTKLLGANPELKLELALHDRVVDLVEEGFDAAIRIGPLPESGLIARPLADYRLLVCAAPAYLKRHGTPRKPEDLERHHCMGFAFWTQQSRWRFMQKGKQHIANITSRLQINNGEALRQAALSGFGVIMQPEVLLEEDVKAGRLMRLLPSFDAPSRPMHLVYLPDRRPTAKMQKFVEFVLATFGRK